MRTRLTPPPRITAKVGDVSAAVSGYGSCQTCRGSSPSTTCGIRQLSWIGARYRHVIRDIDGSPALTKVTTIPKGARSRAWMGHSDLANYTISADARGARE